MAELGLQLPKQFFLKDFEQRWVHLPKRGSSAFQRLWTLEDVSRTAEEGFQAYEFGIPRPEHDHQGSRGAEDALRRNWSLVQNHVQRHHKGLARYLRAASLFFGLPGGLNSYTTPAFSTGFGYHFDPSDTVILQVQASKSWELCKRRLVNSLDFANLSYNQVPLGHEDLSNCTRVVLEEGDALYLPMGQIHRAQASQEMSIHLTMSLNRQFCSTLSVLLNVAEQLNPSKEVGFAQQSFVSWLHSAATESELAFLHSVPSAFRCHGGCPSLEMHESCVAELRSALERLKSHGRAEDVLTMGVRLAGQEEPRVGRIKAKQVLEGIASLLGPEVCQRTISAWKGLLTKHLEELRLVEEKLDVLHGLDLDLLFLDVVEPLGPWSETMESFTWA